MGKKYGSVQGKGAKGQQVDTQFKLPTFAISTKAQSIMEIIYSQLAAYAQTEDVDALLNVRDIVTLFRAQVGLVKPGPAESIVVYNDCIYMSHHLSTLGYGLKLSHPNLQPLATFLDEIPFFYTVATNVVTEELVLFWSGLRFEGEAEGLYDAAICL